MNLKAWSLTIMAVLLSVMIIIGVDWRGFAALAVYSLYLIALTLVETKALLVSAIIKAISKP